MLEVNDFSEIFEILLRNVANEECGHASYVANEEYITELLKVVNISSDAEPDLINFNNNSFTEYVFELDYDEDEGLFYSIWPAVDEHEMYYPNYGLCLVDADVSKDFEREYSRLSDHDKDYIKPIRVAIISEDDGEVDCDDCDAIDCPNKKNSLSTSESVKIDTDDEGRVSGFTKKWKNDHSFFTYTYHSTNEDDVLDAMEKFGINKK